MAAHLVLYRQLPPDDVDASEEALFSDHETWGAVSLAARGARDAPHAPLPQRRRVCVVDSLRGTQTWCAG